MHGIHDCWHPSQLGGDAAVDAWFGVVGVHDVGLEFSEQLVDLAGSPQVREKRHGPGRVLERVKCHASCFYGRDERAGSRGCVHVVAGSYECLELGAE